MTDIDPKLLQWTTPRQRQVLEAWIDLGTSGEAAEALGITPSVVRNTLARVKRKAAQAGYNYGDKDKDYTAPPGYHSRGVSTLTDGKGNIIQRWHKTARDRVDAMAQWMEAIEDMCNRLDGRSIVVDTPVATMDDILVMYSMGDPHLGLIADAVQAGDDWDSDMMRQELVTALAILVDRSPPTTEAHIVNVGDYFHFDTPGKTTTRGTPQDSDLTVEQMMELGLALSVTLIELAKRKHQRVKYVAAKGNHDAVLVFALMMALNAYYRNDPRVDILVDRGDYIYWEWGNNLFGTTHGDKPKKLEDLEAIMARDCDRNGLWKVGVNQHREWLTGHVHHDQIKDMRNVKVRTLRTMAPGSKWSHGAGYRSQQEMRADLYHYKYGRRGEVVVGIDEVRDFIERQSK